MNKQHISIFFAYLIPTFLLGYIWHLVLFGEYYEVLQIYTRLHDPIIPLGILSMCMQGAVYAYLLPKFVRPESVIKDIITYSALFCILAISFAVVAMAAKSETSSLVGWFVIEVSFNVIQYCMFAASLAFIFTRK